MHPIRYRNPGSFFRSSGKERWHADYNRASGSQRLMMDIAKAWAYRLARSNAFKHGYMLREVQKTTICMFNRVYSGKHRDLLMFECAQTLIDHGWWYSERLEDTFFGVFEFRNTRIA